MAQVNNFELLGLGVAQTEPLYLLFGLFPGVAPPVIVAPTIVLPTKASLSDTTALLGGDVTANGGVLLTAAGVVISRTVDNPFPAIGGAGVTEWLSLTFLGASLGVFTVAVTGLAPFTTYSYSAFATNSVGTSYTVVDTFTTLPTVVPLGGGQRATFWTDQGAMGGKTQPYFAKMPFWGPKG